MTRNMHPAIKAATDLEFGTDTYRRKPLTVAQTEAISGPGSVRAARLAVPDHLDVEYRTTGQYVAWRPIGQEQPTDFVYVR